MKLKLTKELPIMAIVALPFIYLAYIWNDLPDRVPMHWNLKGEVDRYGDKTELLIIPFALPLLVYLIFLIVPLIDPKNKIKEMGSKYSSVKVLLTAFMSILAIFIIYTAKNESIYNPNFIFLFIGIMYVLLGNYFKTFKPNYFIGIRTPWTLENEEVWKATHELAGKLWFAGGLMVVLACVSLSKDYILYLFIAITIIITIIPLVYSYFKFQRVTKQNIYED